MAGVPPPARLIRVRRLAIACSALALLGASPAAAAILPPTGDPLPGSSFQGADGDQDPEPARGLADWRTLQAAGRVVHANDPNAQDDAFAGGSKEDRPGEWDFTTETDGVRPPKANIVDAWGSASIFSSRTFLYLGFAREGSPGSGTTFLTFELNRSARMWNNGRARVPCRQTGDVLISYAPHANDVEVIVQRWVTETWDADSGCAATGRLDPVSGLRPNADVQGAVNRDEIDNFLDGAGARIDAQRFGEAAIDFGKPLGEVGGGCFAFTSAWMHSRSSTSESSNMQDYVAPVGINFRRCAASGTKFFDRDADGVRDAGEPGLPRFVVFADYDDDGVRSASEPFTITDANGDYTLDAIRPPDGTYTLREDLLPDAPDDWRCSHPNAGTPGGFGNGAGRFPCGWGPIGVADQPYARNRDFGNWLPAELTVRKELYPRDDPGRFDLLVNGEVVLPGAGDEDSTTVELAPGSHTLSERPVGVPAADYESTVECKLENRPARPAGVSATVELAAGQRMQCTFRNARPGAPGIAIDKAGPAVALAGDTLLYTLRVTNPGDVPFPASAIDVDDPACDDPPELVDKADGAGPDGSPGTLDPGDTWTYRCSRATAEPGDDCELRAVTNTAGVTASASGATVEDESSIVTVLHCPDRPVPPGPPRPPVPLPPPEPEPAGPTDPDVVAPPGPVPPQAGVAGAVVVSRTPACLRRGSRVTLAGVKIARVVVTVGGRVIRGLRVRPLEHRVTIRLRRNFRPGTYRATARTTFQRGSGTAPVTLTRTIRICARPAPRFTG